MKHKLAVLTISLSMLVLLTGCLEGGGGSSSLSAGGDIVAAGQPGSGSSGDDYDFTDNTSGDDYGFDDTSGGIDGEVAHCPEPTTMVLLGSGILIYALSGRKKKKKQP